jgi:uncharacterized alkaline shock family protein YloU
MTKPHEGNAGSGYCIATSVLEAIVKGTVEEETRVRVRPAGALNWSKGIDVFADSQVCRVSIHLDARFGEDLCALGAGLQERVTRALQRLTGLRVEGVTIIFEGVFPPLRTDTATEG